MQTAALTSCTGVLNIFIVEKKDCIISNSSLHLGVLIIHVSLWSLPIVRGARIREL